MNLLIISNLNESYEWSWVHLSIGIVKNSGHFFITGDISTIMHLYSVEATYNQYRVYTRIMTTLLASCNDTKFSQSCVNNYVNES